MNRLLIVTELFHPSMGGQEVRYLELGGLFVRNGWSVDVVTIGFDTSPAEEKIQGMHVRRLLFTDGYRRPDAKLRRDPVAICKFAFQVRKHLRENRYDVVMFNLWPLLPQMIHGIPKAWAKDTVTLVDWCEHRSGSFWNAMNTLQSRSTPKHISVSEGLKRLLATRYGIGDIECIPSGIFVREYRVDEHKAGVLFFGRLSHHKRPEEAIQAMIIAHEKGYGEHLTVAGGGPQLDELREKYSHLDYVRILGRVSDAQKLDLFAKHRIHVLPSIREGFPRTVAESMASGTPTITTDHQDNGTVGVVRQYSVGMVVAPGAKSVAEAILHLANSPEEWQRYHQAGLDHSAELDWQRVYEKFIKHLFQQPTVDQTSGAAN